MTRLIHLADAHLGAPLGGFGKHAPARGEQVLNAFCALPEQAAALDVALVVIAGDLFDGPRPDDATTAAVRETVRRFRDAGIGVVAAPGNHDAASLSPNLYPDLFGHGAFTRPAFDEPITVQTEGGAIHVYGIAWDPAEEPDPLATFSRTDDEGLHIVLLHGAVPGAPHWSGGHSLRLPADRLAALDVDYVALGDYHRFRTPAEFEAPVTSACYAGSFAAVDLSETGRHGFVLVELEEGEPPRTELHDSGVPEVVWIGPFDASRFDSEAEVADAVASELDVDAVPVVELTGEPSFALDPDVVRTELEARFGCAAVRDRTRFFDSTRIADLATEKTIAGHVARLGLERIENAGTKEEREIGAIGLRVALRVMEVE